ncbi:hypothetical protein WOB53_04885 [Providencia rettgeri]|uniref:hypothetical protein n=1 Tax=Providencia rettgeri TaxID=587 RepID=UPI003D2B3399
MITGIPIAALITSTIAIALFIIKEIRESVKKNRSNKNMLNGLCYMFIEQVKFNENVISQINTIEQNITSENCILWMVENMTDKPYITIKLNNRYNGLLVNYPRYDFLESHIGELSALDKDLFDEVVRLIAAMNDLNTDCALILLLLHKNDKKHMEVIKKYFASLNKKIAEEYHPALNNVKSRCEKITIKT